MCSTLSRSFQPVRATTTPIRTTSLPASSWRRSRSGLTTTCSRSASKPLHLASTALADRRDLPGLAAGYIGGEAPFGLPPKVTAEGRLLYNPATEWTGGGLVTTAADLARWAKALYEGEALSGDYLGDLLDAVPKDSTQQARYGPDVRYGLGVTIRPTDLGTAYGHQGWAPGYLSVFEYYPEHEIAIALQVNESGSHDMAAYALRLARVVAASASE